MARRTIAQILERDGLNPAPERNRAPGDGWQSVQIQADPVSGPYDLDNTGEVQRRQRLGGLLNYYYRAAA